MKERITLQKRLASQILKCSHKRVRFDPEREADIKEAITNSDIRALISEGAIRKMPTRGISRGRKRRRADQRRKGRHKGAGSRKGTSTSRLPSKKAWMSRIRLQREFLQVMLVKELITKQAYNTLYRKSKGGFFRNKRHMKLYMNEQKLITRK